MGWTSLRRVESKAAVLAATDSDSPGRYRIIASVTNVIDDDGDIVVPGAYRETLRKRKPKILHAHDWAKPIGKVLDIEEYMPGDPRLPSYTPNGDPWPEGAGALVADIQLFMATQEGKAADERIRQYGSDAQWSIGYRVKKANRSKEARLLRLLDLYEISEVLWGANDLTGPMPEMLALKMLAGVMEEKELPEITDEDSLRAAVRAYRENPTRELREYILEKAEELDLEVPDLPMPDEETDPEPKEEAGEDLTSDEESEAPANDDEAEPDGGAELERADIPNTDDPNPDDEDAVGELHSTGTARENWDDVRSALRYCEAYRDLDDDEEGEKRAYSTEQRDQMAESGVALPDGSYPIRDRTDLLNAIQAVGRAKDYDRARRHIIKRARALGAVDLLPDEWEVKALPKTQACKYCEGKATKRVVWANGNAYIPVCDDHEGKAREVIADQNDEVDEVVPIEGKELDDVEEKGGVPGVADTPEDIQSVRRLRRWYVRGEGAARIMWGTPGSFRRCVAIAGKHMSPENAKGYCALRYKEATGRWPGRQRGDKKQMTLSEFNAALAVTLMEGKMSSVSTEAVVDAAKRLLEALVEEGVVVKGVTDDVVEAVEEALEEAAESVEAEAESEEVVSDKDTDTEDADEEVEPVAEADPESPAAEADDVSDESGEESPAPADSAVDDADDHVPAESGGVPDDSGDVGVVSDDGPPVVDEPVEPGVEIDMAEVEALLQEVDPAAL